MVNLHPAVILDNIARTTPARPVPLVVCPPSILDAVVRTRRGSHAIRPSCLWTGFLLGLACAGLAAIVVAAP